MKKASELEIGEICMTKDRVDGRRIRQDENPDMVALLTATYEIIAIRPDEEVYATFGFDCPKSPEDDRALVAHIKSCIERVGSTFELNSVHTDWEERMKELAAKTLKPGEDFPLQEWEGHLALLDYIWDISGDRMWSSSQTEPFRPRAVDYYIGRRCEHIWGDGVLVKILSKEPHELDKLKEDQYVIRPNLAARGVKHGIKLDYPCECGKTKHEMFAVPGVHTGAFAYLLEEETDRHLDVRNQCITCDNCGPRVREQLEAIDRGDFDDFEDDEN